MTTRTLWAVLSAVVALVLLPVDPAHAAPPVVVGHAGMLTDLVQKGLSPEVAGAVEVASRGGPTLKVARDIRDGAVAGDLFGSADATANGILLRAAGGGRGIRWYAAFARAEIVLAYSPSSTTPRKPLFDAAAQGKLAWYEPLRRRPDLPDARIGRSNPDEDPSGYYTLFVMQLAERFHDKPGLKQEVLGDDLNPAQVGQGTPARLSSGAIDAMFTYKNIALASGLPFLRLPAEVNLSDPDQAEFYATASYTNTIDGSTRRGVVIRPTVAPVEVSPNPAGGELVLRHLFEHRQRLVGAARLEPSDLYAGGNPAAVPVELRPYFHLRRLRLTAEVAQNDCRAGDLEVSGVGALVVAAEPVSDKRCGVIIEASTGATGDRELYVVRRIAFGSQSQTVILHKVNGSVPLAEAIPVKPPFLD